MRNKIDKVLRDQVLAYDKKKYPYASWSPVEGTTYFRAMISETEIDEPMQYILRKIGYKIEIEGGDLFLAELNTGDVYPLKTFYVPGMDGVWTALDFFTQLAGSVD